MILIFHWCFVSDYRDLKDLMALLVSLVRPVLL